ncbi:MAG: DinB family protein [Bacteroidota bacterium]|jgi:hypothetical protein
MRELTEYRRNLINRLVAAAHEFQAECLAVKDVFTPLAPGDWNTHQVAAHTRDVDKLVYGARVRRTAAEDNPEFESFDGETHIAQHYSTAEPLEEILNELVNQVESLAGMLRDLPPQVWARVSSHVMLGRGITLQSWVEKDLAHIEEHLKTVENRQKD